MDYPVGAPFWKLAARAGVRLKVQVHIHRDEAAGVYFAHAPKMRGLVAEADTLDLLHDEVRNSARELLEIELNGAMPATRPELVFRDDALCAA